MLDLDKTGELPAAKVEELRKIIESHREELKEKGLYINDIVREDIFQILDDYCTVVFFPLDKEEENDGFHITMPVGYKQDTDTEHFVFLNTENPIEKQVFAAAHELGHIWVREDQFWDDELEKTIPRNQENLEAVMNRFAAELLMPEKLFRQSAVEHLKKYITKERTIFFTDTFRLIAGLMDEFCVPAQAVIGRLYETMILKKEACRRLLVGSEQGAGPEGYQELFESTLKMCIKEGGYTKLLKSTGKKGIKDFPEVLSKIEGKGIFSEERIEELRGMLEIPKIEPKEETFVVEETKQGE